MPGKLTVCPTPIGNLEDITDARSRTALAEADIVACEDTRRAGRLFERLEIQRRGSSPTTRATRPSARASSPRRSSAAAKVVLISDAGTPAISDPGYRLIRACIERDLEIEVLPGPSAVTRRWSRPGCPPHRWRFEGFLPRRAGELERVLAVDRDRRRVRVAAPPAASRWRRSRRSPPTARRRSAAS